MNAAVISKKPESNLVDVGRRESTTSIDNSKSDGCTKSREKFETKTGGERVKADKPHHDVKKSKHKRGSWRGLFAGTKDF